MKKIAMFFLVTVIIIVGMSYIYLNYISSYNTSKTQNIKFESYYNYETTGTDVATVINRAVDNNIKNNVEKNNKGKFIDNNTNSINIQIKILDNDTTYDMETFYNNGIDKFVQAFGDVGFKCTIIEYHKSTNKVKYMLFEQITE